MDFRLQDKVAVIVGGSKGIGREIALALAREGMHVAACARQPEPLQVLRTEVQALGVRCFTGTADAADAASLAAFLDRAHEHFGAIDLLVNNASALGGASDAQAWLRNIDLDLMAAVRATEHVVPWMKAEGSGNVLFIGSVSGMEASGTALPYSALKAAVISYSKGLSLQLAPHRIRVNTISPGMIEFPGGVWDERRRNQPELYEKFRSQIPWGRPGKASEIANLAVFLASEVSEFITGACVAVDGGKRRSNI